MNIENKSAFIKPKKADYNISAWIGHIPFASWLITELKPKIFVELGTHTGASFLAFCQSIAENSLSTKAYAVDVWKGDNHSGYYNQEIYDDLKSYVDENYSEFATLKKMTFNEAVNDFEDGTIDLLHIDGFHTYDAVKNDFYTWKEKLSDKAVVIFHDTQEIKEDFGVYKFWSEILNDFPGFEFKFWHGLGVLLVGSDKNQYLLELCSISPENKEFENFSFLFETLANSLTLNFEKELLEKKIFNELIPIKKENSLLKDKIKNLDAVITENISLKDENNRLNVIVNAIYSSRSWKFGKVIRGGGNLLRGRGFSGKKERFNEKWYLANNPDIKKDEIDPYKHYIIHGKQEGRLGYKDTLIVKNYKRINILMKAHKNLKSKNLKTSELINSALKVYKKNGINGLKNKIFQIVNPTPKNTDFLYEQWVLLYDTLTNNDILEIKEKIKLFHHRPLISIVMPVYNTDINFLKQAIDSVLEQIYENWELCIADDNSTNPKIQKILQNYEEKDRRIKVVYRNENGHISLSSNSALNIANGEYTALMDHDDLIPKHALYMAVDAINRMDNKIDLLYTDEDKIDSNNKRSDPYFKMEWDETLINSQNYVAHLGIYRTSIMKKINGFRKGFEGSQDYDLLLRFLRETKKDRIIHIPYVLYHWRIFEGNSTFSTDNHNISDNSAYKALKENFEVLDQNVEILPIKNFPGSWKIKRNLPDHLPKVTLIIPTRDRVDILKNCVDGILNNTDYENFELIIVDNDSVEQSTFKYFERIKSDKRVTILNIKGEFNYAKLNNLAVNISKGDYIVFMNNDLEIINNYWLKEILKSFLEDNIGIVGAKLYYRNNTIQHAGCVTGIYDVAGHIHKHLGRNSPGYFAKLALNHNVSAVTGACLAIKKEIFEEVGGFDQEKLKVSYNDVDLCLKVRNKGYKVILNPDVELYHLESVSRGEDTNIEKRNLNRNERRVMISRYGSNLKHDPFYSPNLTLENEDVLYSFSPRLIKPWREHIEFVCPFHRGDVLIGLQVANFYSSQGKKIRFHVSEKLISWVKDFNPKFEVLSIPTDLPKANETMEFFEKAVRYVENLPDFSGRIARSHPKMNFDFMGLNIVEHMLNELELSIDSKIERFKPQIKNKDKEEAKIIINSFGVGKIVLLHPFGGWKLKSIPKSIIDKLIKICNDKDVKLIQIGGKGDEKLKNLDGYILENFSLSKWRAIFEESDSLIGIDSWSSHFAAILGINQFTLYGSTKARDVNINKFFSDENTKSIIFDSTIDCAPCHLLKCKYNYSECKGYHIDMLEIEKYMDRNMKTDK